MDQRERAGDPMEALRVAMDGREAQTWQGGPGIIQSFNAVKMTCVVQPAVQGRNTDPSGKTIFVNLPLLLDVPVVFQSGGGATLTFGIGPGDECWFSIADRCIDAWWQQGGIQPDPEVRMHDLSDAFAFVGPRSQPRVLGGISTTTAQLRADDGATVIELDPVGQKINLTAPGGSTINADTTINGALHVTGAVTFDSTLNVTGTTTVAEIDATEVKIGGVVVVAP